MKSFTAFVMTLYCAYASSAYAQFLHPSIKDAPKEIQQLHSRQAMFLRTWYWKMDERMFWKYVSRHGPLDRNRDADIFFNAFTKPLHQVNVGTRQSRSADLRKILGPPGQMFDYELLNERNENFWIIRADLHEMPNNPKFEYDTKRQELFFKNPPPTPYLITLYTMQGDGFTIGLVTTIWVKEKDTWMIWNILYE